MKPIEESTLNQLYNSAVRAFPNTRKRQHATDPLQVVEMSWLPFLGMKTLFVKGRVQSEGKNYDTVVLFKNVKYDLTEGGDEMVFLYASDGLVYHFQPIKENECDVVVRCNCPDFRWRFNYYNHKDKSLYGNKARKYEGAGGPPANPLQMPGMCKHLMKTVTALSRANLFAS